MPATDLFKHHRRLSTILAGAIVIAAMLTTGGLFLLTAPGIDAGHVPTFKVILYSGLCVILVSAGAALWIARIGLQPGPIQNANPRLSRYHATADVKAYGMHASNQLMAMDWVESPRLRVEASCERTLFEQPLHAGQAPPFGTSGRERMAMDPYDIGERKKIEQEIQHQNRKITESIRYAKRIQGAILPNTRVIGKVLPDSFILYKPRDVVSGDFPWFAQVKEDIFMAAVDCTGHGVPGALLSLVGYFLLNDIVRGRRVTDTGKILDLLDEGVSATLRPDEEAGTKDGMDISLCRINLERREIEYAGAHRPLYFVHNGVLEEIKGNKFPIGGGIFKNQSNFSRSTLHFRAGDAVFFCSDGFCDQFGGPKGRKFGTRQLKEIISKVHKMPMKEAAKVMEHEWESWKGKQKQVDDVLLIGIRFS